MATLSLVSRRSHGMALGQNFLLGPLFRNSRIILTVSHDFAACTAEH